MSEKITKRRKPCSERKADGDREQSRRFIEAARELGADQPEEAFNEALKRLAQPPAGKRQKGRKHGEE